MGLFITVVLLLDVRFNKYVVPTRLETGIDSERDT